MGSFLMLLGASWGLFWCSWGLQVAPRILKTFYLGTLEPPSWPPRSPQQPQTAPQAPSWRGRGPHEATKAHLETHLDICSGDLRAKSKKHLSKRHRSCLSKRFSALELCLHLLHPLLPLLLLLLLILLLLCPLRLPHYHYKTKTKTETRTTTRTKIKIKTETKIKTKTTTKIKTNI